MSEREMVLGSEPAEEEPKLKLSPESMETMETIGNLLELCERFMGRPAPFIIDVGDGVIKQVSVTEWRKWWATNGPGRIVRQDASINDGVLVSTVCLGMDHGFGGETGLYYETMILGGPHDGYQRRYATRAEALTGHAGALIVAGKPPVRP